MDLSKQEINRLIAYAEEHKRKCETGIRRVRRNMTMLLERYNEAPTEVVEDCGLEHPDEQIENFKIMKKEAVIIKKKLEML